MNKLIKSVMTVLHTPEAAEDGSKNPAYMPQPN